MIVDFIIMAAGNSRRFGSNKLLYRIQGKPMFEYVLDQVELAMKELLIKPMFFDSFPPDRLQTGKQASSGHTHSEIICRIFVVSRYDEILQEADRRGWTAVFSPESVQGTSHTIKNGIRAAGEHSDYYMFLTADQPCLKAASIVNLVRETMAAEKGIGSMCLKDQPGNPVIFHRKYLTELLALEGDTGGRRVVKKYLSDCYFCQVQQQEELTDADTLESLDFLLDYMKKM